jgi:transposase
MAKYDKKFRLVIVKRFLTGGMGAKRLGVEYGLAHAMIHRWVASYRIHGEAGLEPKYGVYDAAFRLRVLRRKWREDLSCNQAAAIFGIRSPASIGQWERQYHAGGVGALAPRARGRPKAMAKPTPPPSKPAEAVVPDEARAPKDLLRELEYLRAENAYLKKLDALIQTKKAARKKRS